MDAPITNVVPLRKVDSFPIFRAELASDGSVNEGLQLGIAFLQPQGRGFRLKLWMFPQEKYFLVGSDDRSTYRVLLPHKMEKSAKSYWNEVGSGVPDGPFIRIRLYLPDQEILLRLLKPAAEGVKSDAA